MSTAYQNLTPAQLREEYAAVKAQFDALKAKELKEKYGGATPAETVKAMLLPGEIEDLSRAVERLCGFRRITIDEVKNA